MEFDFRMPIVLLIVASYVGGDLVINVGNSPNGLLDDAEAEIPRLYRQTLMGNASTDTALLEYAEPDGTAVTLLIDFRMQSQVLRIIIPGEEELGEPIFQTLCFVSSFTGDFIAPEAVMKLRQKHPSNVRVAESDEGEVVQDSNLQLKATKNLHLISTHLPGLCNKDAGIFSSNHELHSILKRKSQHFNVETLIKSLTRSHGDLPRCPLTTGNNESCQCTRQVWLHWYPCALKYCRNKDGEGEHRCGIKTCKKCLTYRYPGRSRKFCTWDQVWWNSHPTFRDIDFFLSKTESKSNKFRFIYGSMPVTCTKFLFFLYAWRCGVCGIKGFIFTCFQAFIVLEVALYGLTMNFLWFSSSEIKLALFPLGEIK